MRISDWSSDVCSSDLPLVAAAGQGQRGGDREQAQARGVHGRSVAAPGRDAKAAREWDGRCVQCLAGTALRQGLGCAAQEQLAALAPLIRRFRSEEHTSELQSLMRTSYAVFCLKK